VVPAVAARSTQEIFQKRLLETRERRAVTQVQLAVKAGLRGSVVSNFETGLRKPSIEQLVKLADALGVSTDYLLGRDEDAG
jgi:transcriptional regulator with XRE-family HTH domain